MLDPKQYFQILKEYQLTFEEFQLCYSLYLSIEDKTIIKDLRSYLVDTAKRINQAKLVQGLVEKGYLHNDNRPDSFDVKYLEVTPKFTEGLFIPADKAYKEFLAIYPDYLYINGDKVRAKTGHHDEIESYYFTKVIDGGNKQLHAEILAIVDAYFDRITPRGSDRRAECNVFKFLKGWKINKHTYLPPVESRIVRQQDRLL